MKITQNEISRYVFLASNSSYNDNNKVEFKKLGRKILKYVANQLGLINYNIRFNAGGIAVSGDNILHDERFYLALHDNLGSGSFYFRGCKGLKDYIGEYNQWVNWDNLKENGIDYLIERLRQQFYPNGF